MNNAHDCSTNDFSVELNMVGRNLDPDRISTILGISASKSARAGEAREHCRNGSAYELGFWAHEASSTDEVTQCRDHQLACLADTVAPHAESLREAGVERIYFYYTMSSFIGLLNIRFNAETMRKLGELNADLYVSCYDCFDPQHPFWKLESSGKA